MFDFQALNSKYEQEVKELVEQKDMFDIKSKQYDEAVANLKTMKDEEIKKMISEESDRLRERRENIEKKVKDHNKTTELLEVRKNEVLKDGDNFVAKQEEVKKMQEEVGGMVAELQKIQADV